MDLIAYLAVLAMYSVIKLHKNIDIDMPVQNSITGMVQSIPTSDLPLSSNLMLIKEEGAFTLILEELGLK